MELYARVRRAVFVEGVSEREAAKRFGLARETVRKMLRYAAPPGYRRQKPIRRPKLDAYTPIIDQILETDLALAKKQRHTAQRIFERLRDEHDFAGGYTIIKDYVRLKRTSQVKLQDRTELQVTVPSAPAIGKPNPVSRYPPTLPPGQQVLAPASAL